jgi:prepilin-type N-terminal cleavage/methylation domain-containing protein
MRQTLKKAKFQYGFSLGEMLMALVIGAMVLSAVLTIYSRADHSAASILSRIDNSSVASEVLQRIAEDLDEVITAGSDTVITIDNKVDNGFAKAQLVIRQTMYNGRNEEQTYKEIIWQAAYDYEGVVPGQVLYRSCQGVGLEDRLLDEQREDLEKNYPFVPVCRGVTFFKIEVPRGDTSLEKWTSPTLPPGIKVTISFAEPFKAVTGNIDVPDEYKISRTIALDRTRKIAFEIPPTDNKEEDPNAKTLQKSK